MSIKTVMVAQSLTDILGALLAEEKLDLACRVLDKNQSDYEHLDRGRMAMTGGNMLRNALKKDESLLARIAEEAAAIMRHRDPSVVPAPKKESSEKRKGPSSTGDHIRANEKNWGKREIPVWDFTEKELDRLELEYLTDENLRKAGKLPPRNIVLVATPTTLMDFRGGSDGNYKYFHVKSTKKSRLTIR